MKRGAAGRLFIALLFLGACNDMKVQPKYTPLDPSPFFADGRSTRMPVADTVSRGNLRLDDHLYTGKVNGKFVETFPFPITSEILNRGQERYAIFCSMCHGATGDGNGMIVQRGFKAPASYHVDRLRNESAGYFYDVITNGYGIMYSYGDRIPVSDRWAIVAYIRALQLSQNGRLLDVPQPERDRLERSR